MQKTNRRLPWAIYTREKSRDFYRELIIDSLVQIVITNNRDFTKYLFRDYGENTKVIVIDKDSCVPNKMGVRYFYLYLSFFFEKKMKNWIYFIIFAKKTRPCYTKLVNLRKSLFPFFPTKSQTKIWFNLDSF